MHGVCKRNPFDLIVAEEAEGRWQEVSSAPSSGSGKKEIESKEVYKIRKVHQ